VVKQCRKVLLSSFDWQQDMQTSELLEKSDCTNLEALNELIDLLDNQLNPEQKISLEVIRKQILHEKDGNQAVI
jgi:hypothetical protein